MTGWEGEQLVDEISARNTLYRSSASATPCSLWPKLCRSFIINNEEGSDGERSWHCYF
jgi:hypothetical protein